MTDRSNEILENVLSMNDAQLAKFMATLSPDQLSYLEILLDKAIDRPTRLKKHLNK